MKHFSLRNTIFITLHPKSSQLGGDRERNKSLTEMCIGAQWVYSLAKYFVSIHLRCNSFLNKSNDTLLSRVMISQVELPPNNLSLHGCQRFPGASLHCLIH